MSTTSTTHICIGFSKDPNPRTAAQEACAHIQRQMFTPQIDLILLFTTMHYVQPEVMPTIQAALKPKRLVGCSTAGILLEHEVMPRGLIMMAINSEDIPFGVGMLNLTTDYRNFGFELARRANLDLDRPQRQAALVFTDHTMRNGAFLKGMQEVLGVGFPIFGAGASDAFTYKKTYQFFQAESFSNAAVGLLIGGNSAAAVSTRHGFKPLGKPRTITKSNDHVIRTIDKEPASQIFVNYMGKDAQDIDKGILNTPAMLYPLGIYEEAEHQYLLRNPIDILADGSIVCQGNVPEGSEVHFMIATKDACRRAAIDAANEIKDILGGRTPKLILVFESMARHKLVGRLATSEMLAIKEVLGHQVPAIGIYSSTELGPMGSIKNSKHLYVHNENLLIFALG